MEEVRETNPLHLVIDDKMLEGLAVTTDDAAKQHFLAVFSNLVQPDVRSIGIRLHIEDFLEPKDMYDTSHALSVPQIIRFGLFQALLDILAARSGVDVTVELPIDPAFQDMLIINFQNSQNKFFKFKEEMALDSLLGRMRNGEVAGAIADAEFLVENYAWCEHMVKLGTVLAHNFRTNKEESFYPQITGAHMVEICRIVKDSGENCPYTEDEDGRRQEVGEMLLEFYDILCQEHFSENSDWREYEKLLLQGGFIAACMAGDFESANTYFATWCGDTAQSAGLKGIFTEDIFCDPMPALLALGQHLAEKSEQIKKLEETNKALEKKVGSLQDKTSSQALIESSSRPRKRPKLENVPSLVDYEDSDTDTMQPS